MLLALLGAVNASYACPTLALASEQDSVVALVGAPVGSNCSTPGPTALNTAALTQDGLQALRALSAEDPFGLQIDGDGYHVLLDSCSNLFTAMRMDNFEPSSVHELEQPFELGGVGGGIVITHKGTIRYDFVTKGGGVKTVRREGFYGEGMKFRLAPPQQILSDPKDAFVLHPTGILQR